MKIGNLFGQRESAMRRSVGDDKVMGGNFDGKEAAIATGIGAGVGALVGGVVGYSNARSDIAKVPVESVTLSWREPVTKEVTIGNIPHDQYFPANKWLSPCDGFGQSFARPSVSPDLRGTEPVVRQAPVLDTNGHPVYREVTKTFADHGRPTVHTQTRTVTNPVLDPSQPFDQRMSDDTHWATCDAGRDDQGNPQTRTVTVLDGVRVTFEPNVKNVPVNSPNNSYQTKSVTFDSGVDVGGQVLRGVLVGAGIGAVVGLVGDIAKQTLANRG